MRRLSDEHKTPEDFITKKDMESTPHKHASQYTVESMKRHHDAVVYYKQRSGGSWFQGRVSQEYKDGYAAMRWDKDKADEE